MSTRTRGFIALLSLLTLVACGQDRPGTSATPQNITGAERLGWDQQAGSPGQLASYRYALYVGGLRSELSDVTCATRSTAAGFPCSGRLPELAPGTHTLELATFVMSAGALVESSRSAPLIVTVAGRTASASTGGRQAVSRPDHTSTASALPAGLTLTTGDGVRMRVDIVADGLEEPTDLAFAPDGRLVITERRGRVRVLSEDRLDSEATPIQDVAMVGARGGLLSVAVDPEFERTGFVYLLHVAAGPDNGPVFRLTRVREAGGRFAERAVLMDSIPASPHDPAGSLRFGPDGKLYLALDDGGDARNADRLASFNGKILRLNPDGSTPADQSASSPVRSAGHHSPRGFDWQPVTGALWIGDVAADRSERLTVIARDSREPDGTPLAVLALPEGARAAAPAFYRGTLMPQFEGDLFLATREREALLRIRFESGNPLRVAGVEHLLEGLVGAIGTVVIGPDGAVYLSTETAVLRLGPRDDVAHDETIRPPAAGSAPAQPPVRH